MRHRIPYMLGVLLLVSALGICEDSCAQQAEEYALKASYVERFMKFVSWPAENDGQHSRAFVISVLGKNPFNGSLDDVSTRILPSDRKVRVTYISDIKEATNCNLLFISDSESERLPSILEQVGGKEILTISDADGFGEAGVMINFYVEGAKLHFEINLEAARESGLEFDPLLLDYARIVDSSGVPDDES